MPLAIEAGQQAVPADRGGIEEPAEIVELGETDNRCHPVAGEPAKDRLECSARNVQRDRSRVGRVVGQTAEHAFGAAENRHVLRFAPFDLFADEVNRRLHRSRRQERCLIRSDLHPTTLPPLS